MEKPIVQLKEVTTPTGYKVTLKTRLTAGEDMAITSESMGDLESNFSNAQEVKIKFSQALEMAPITILHWMDGWDAMENGQPIPITLETIKSTLFAEDLDFLSKEIESLKGSGQTSESTNSSSVPSDTVVTQESTPSISSNPNSDGQETNYLESGLTT